MKLDNSQIILLFSSLPSFFIFKTKKDINYKATRGHKSQVSSPSSALALLWPLIYTCTTSTFVASQCTLVATGVKKSKNKNQKKAKLHQRPPSAASTIVKVNHANRKMKKRGRKKSLKEEVKRL